MGNNTKRNFLRFGKRSNEEWMDPSKEAEGGGDNEENGIQNMHRRDYREFVRFGKRATAAIIDAPWIPAAAAAAAAAAKQDGEKRRDDFLRFGRTKICVGKTCYQEGGIRKKSNDFLRFG